MVRRLKKFIICNITVLLILFLNFPTFTQGISYDISGNSPILYGGKPLLDSQFTIGGRKLQNLQPHYGGKRIDEQALYNPHLEEAFKYMGKPLFSPNPYSYPRVIGPKIYNQQSIPTDNNVPFSSPPDIRFRTAREENNKSSSQKQVKGTSLSPIIPAIIGAIDALYKGNKKDGFSGSKRLSLDGWYGNIRISHGESGNFNFHNSRGESVSGTYYMSGSRINFNIQHYENGKNNYWQGSSSQWGSGSSVNLRSNYLSLSGSSSSFGDTYRYRFNSSGQTYEVEIRDISSASQSIRVKGNNYIPQYGYIN